MWNLSKATPVLCMRILISCAHFWALWSGSRWEGGSNTEVDAHISPPDTLCSFGLWCDRDTHDSHFSMMEFFRSFIYYFHGSGGSLSLHAAVSRCSGQRPLFTAVCGVLAWLPLGQQPALGEWTSVGVAPGLELWLSCCGSGPQLPCGVWDLPRAEIKPVCLPLQGRFLTTGPQGSPWMEF